MEKLWLCLNNNTEQAELFAGMSIGIDPKWCKIRMEVNP